MTEILAIREADKATVVELLSELDRLSVLSMKNQLTELAKKKRRKFVIDFSKMDYINCTVISALVGMRDAFRRRGGDLVVCCLKANIRRTFDLIGAAKILTIYDTPEDALEDI